MVTRMTAYTAAGRATQLLTNLAIIVDNRRRALLHAPTTAAVVAEMPLAGAALASTGAAHLGEMQRGPSGSLDRASNGPGR